MKLPLVIDRWLQRAEQVVTIYTLLAGIVGFGLGACLWGPLRGLYLALGTFGAVGALDVFHRQAKAQLDQRRVARDRSGLYLAIYDKHPDWNPKVLKEFAHGGLRFHALGFEQSPIPFTVSQPLCPACKGPLVELAEVRFPGRTQLRHECPWGFAQQSGRTLSELHAEAGQLANAPRDFPDA